MMYTINWLAGGRELNFTEADLARLMAEYGLYRTGLTLKTKLGTIVGVLVPDP